MKSDEWRPNLQGSIPIYHQVVAFIKEKIAYGEWPIGFRIPSERAFAKQLGINRSTVAAAFAELAAEGLIRGKRGSGTCVINNTWTLLASTKPPNWQSYVEAGIHRPNISMIQRINREEFVPGIIRLGTGEMATDMFPPRMAQQVLERTAKRIQSLGYEEPQGLYELREAISRYVASFGIQASPSSILIVSGALQALHLISIGLLPPDANILLEKPSYLYSVRVFQSAGMQLAGIPEIDNAETVSSMLAYNRRKYGASLLYTIPSFHNPTGRMMDGETRKQLLEACEQQRLPVIEDDVYGELWFDRCPPKPLKAHDKNGLVLYIGSLSKTLSAGLRIGWIIGPEPVIHRLADIKMQTDYGSSSLSQWMAKEWLTSGLYEEHLLNIRQELRIRRDQTLEALSKHMKGLASWNAPDGGFYIWLRLLPDIALSKLFELALRQGILLNPGNIYDPEERQHLRLSYAYASHKDMEEGIRRLSMIVKELAHSK